MIMTAEVVMVGSAAVSSAACCATPSHRAASSSRALAIVMLAAMVTMLFGQPVLSYAGAGVTGLFALALASLARIVEIGVNHPQLHRGIGALLMAGLIAGHTRLMDVMATTIPRTTGRISGGHVAGMQAMPGVPSMSSDSHHGVPHGLGTHLLVAGLIVAFVGFVVWTLVHARDWATPGAAGSSECARGRTHVLVRLEVLAMVTGLGVMAISVLQHAVALHG